VSNPSNETLSRPGGLVPIYLAVVYYIRGYLDLTFKNNFHRKVLRRKDYEWKFIGDVRSTQINDGTLRSVLRNYFELINRSRNVSYSSNSLCNLLARLKPTEFAKVTSALNNYVKGSLLRVYPVENCINFIDLQTLVGYPKSSDRVFKNDIPGWLVDKDNEYDRVVYNKVEINSIFSELFGVTIPGNFDYKNFTEYLLARGTWINSGSSKYSKLTVLEKDKYEKLKTKLGVALTLSDRELLKLCDVKQILREGFHAFVKSDEKGVKGRYIINVPFGLYVLQKYVIDKFLFLKPQYSEILGLVSSGNKVINLIRQERGGYFIPLDFDSFDHHVSFELYYLFYDYLELTMPEEKNIINMLRKCHTKMPVFDVDGIKLGYWSKGVPSGMYMTAFFDTLVNIVYSKLVGKMLPVKVLYARGDDSVLYDKNNVNLTLLSEAYKNVGAKVNVEKNWKSATEFEILKMMCTYTEVFQYPARAFASVAWSYPDYRNNTISNKLNTIVSVWKEFADRILMDADEFEKLVIREFNLAFRNRVVYKSLIQKQFKQNQFFKIWLHTPNQFGGFGLIPLSVDYQFKVKQKTINLKSNSKYPYPIIKSIVYSIDMDNNNAEKKINTMFHLDLTLRDIAGLDKPITWQVYLRFFNILRNNFLLASDKQFRVRMDSSSTVIFRMIGLSDSFVDSLYRVQFKGISQQYVVLLNYVLRRMSMLPILRNRSQNVK